MSYHQYRQPSLSPRAPHQQSGCSVCGYGQWFPVRDPAPQGYGGSYVTVCVISTFQCYLSHSFVSCFPINAPRNTASILTERTTRLNTSVCQVRSLRAPWKTRIYEWKELVGVEVVGVLTSIWTALRTCNYDYERVLKSLRQFSPCDWLWIGREAMVRRKSTLCLPGTLRVFVKWQDLSFRSRITSHYLELVVVYSSSI